VKSLFKSVLATFALIGFKSTYIMQLKIADSSSKACDLKRPSHQFIWNKLKQLSWPEG